MAERKKTTDWGSFMTGVVKGITKTIDRKAKEEEREVKLKQEITKHMITKRFDMQLQRNWMKELEGSVSSGEQDFTKTTQEPATDIANLFGKGGARQVGTVQTRETPQGRVPAARDVLAVDYSRLGSARTPTISSSGGVGSKPMGSVDKQWATYNTLKKIEGSGQKLNPTQQSILKGLQKRLFGAGEASYTGGEREVLGEIRAMKNAQASIEDINEVISLSGYEPERFASELEGYGEQSEFDDTESPVNKANLFGMGQKFDRRVKDNVIYEKRQDGLWHPIQS